MGHGKVDPALTQAIVDRHHNGAGPVGEFPRNDVGLGHLQVAEHERATVGPHEPAVASDSLVDFRTPTSSQTPNNVDRGASEKLVA